MPGSALISIKPEKVKKKKSGGGAGGGEGRGLEAQGRRTPTAKRQKGMYGFFHSNPILPAAQLGSHSSF